MKIPGLGGRRTYFSGETFAILTDSYYQDRIDHLNNFFNPMTRSDQKAKFLQNAKITHIYSDQENQTLELKKLEENQFPITKIYQHNQYAIFKVL